MRRLVIALVTAALVGACASPGHPERPPVVQRVLAHSALLQPAAAATGELEAHFIDVGQGDCTFVRFPGGGTMLVDCGTSSGGRAAIGLRAREYVRGQLDPNDPWLDTLVITHPDADHYNLLPYVLNGVRIRRVLIVGELDDYRASALNSSGQNISSSQKPMKSWLSAFGASRRITLGGAHLSTEAEGSALFEAGDGFVYVLAAGATGSNSSWVKNTSSIVLLAGFGAFEMVLTGDATFETETAIASAGADNTYGHPRKTVIERLEPFTLDEVSHRLRWWKSQREDETKSDYRESVFSTADSGTVVVRTNGEWYTVGAAD
jgi:beta-lactamase superfamily II metal-dependent hydrolase